jgi:Flp pilus assembly protein protease CpaA
MLQIIEQITTADHYTWTMAIVLTLCASAVVQTMSGSMVLTALYTPVLLAGALTGAWVFRAFEVLGTTHVDLLVVISCSAGLVVIMPPLMLLTRVFGVAHDVCVRAPRQQDIYIRPQKLRKEIPADWTI